MLLLLYSIDNEELLNYDEEGKLMEDYNDFYTDVRDELTQRWGEVVGLRSCRNKSAHLRGNAIVEFADDEIAERALAGCTSRWYAGRPITARLAYLGGGWRAACCGDYKFGPLLHYV